MPPRFSVVIPVRDRAETVGRAVAAVLTQTFGDLEVVVVDDGSTDDTVAAAHSARDDRLRVVRQDPAGPAAACRAGLAAARGRWALLLDADTEVAAGWLARIGRLADATGAAFVTCGGEHRHHDGSTTEVVPTGSACLRPAAFATDRRLLAEAATRVDAARDSAGLDSVGAISAVGRQALVLAMATDGTGTLDLRDADADADADAGTRATGDLLGEDARAEHPVVTRTPERLVLWHDPTADDSAVGDELRLRWSWQVLDALSRTPIPDGDLLARAATVGGMAATRLGRSDQSRLLFGIACRARPGVGRHWARWAVSCVPPLSRRVWDRPPPAAGDADDGAGLVAPATVGATGAADH